MRRSVRSWGCVKGFLRRFAPNYVLRLSKKVFAAFGGRIFFGWRLVFHDFAKRNHEKQVSIQTLFGLNFGLWVNIIKGLWENENPG